MKNKFLYLPAILLLSAFLSCQSEQKPTQPTGQDSGTNTIDGTPSQNSDADTAIAPGRPPEDNNK